jgi:hypothetical protein
MDIFRKLAFLSHILNIFPLFLFPHLLFLYYPVSRSVALFPLFLTYRKYNQVFSHTKLGDIWNYIITQDKYWSLITLSHCTQLDHYSCLSQP